MQMWINILRKAVTQETEEARKEAYSEFEKAYAKAPNLLFIRIMCRSVSGLDGLIHVFWDISGVMELNITK